MTEDGLFRIGFGQNLSPRIVLERRSDQRCMCSYYMYSRSGLTILDRYIMGCGDERIPAGQCTNIQREDLDEDWSQRGNNGSTADRIEKDSKMEHLKGDKKEPVIQKNHV